MTGLAGVGVAGLRAWGRRGALARGRRGALAWSGLVGLGKSRRVGDLVDAVFGDLFLRRGLGGWSVSGRGGCSVLFGRVRRVGWVGGLVRGG